MNIIFIHALLLIGLTYLPNVSAIWQPEIGLTWNLIKEQDPNEINYNKGEFDVIDINLFEIEKETIEKFHNDGLKVICYLSAGTYEEEIEDMLWINSLVRSRMEDDNGNWLDYRYDGIKDYMIRALDLAKEKGCDGVEFDNIDGFAFVNWCNFLTAQDQLKYNLWLAKEAHIRGLAAGIKNCLILLDYLKYDFDFVVNESCVEDGECALYSTFLELGKPVFTALYTSDVQDICNYIEIDMSVIIKEPDQELDYNYIRFNYNDSCKTLPVDTGNIDPIKTDTMSKSTTTTTTTENGEDGPITVVTKIDTTKIITENNGVITVKTITETTTTKTKSSGVVTSSKTTTVTTTIISGGNSNTTTTIDTISSDAVKSDSSSITTTTTTNLNTKKSSTDSKITSSNVNGTSVANTCPAVNSNNGAMIYICSSVNDVGSMVYNCPSTDGGLKADCITTNELIKLTIDDAINSTTGNTIGNNNSNTNGTSIENAFNSSSTNGGSISNTQGESNGSSSTIKYYGNGDDEINDDDGDDDDDDESRNVNRNRNNKMNRESRESRENGETNNNRTNRTDRTSRNNSNRNNNNDNIINNNYNTNNRTTN